MFFKYKSEPHLFSKLKLFISSNYVLIMASLDDFVKNNAKKRLVQIQCMPFNDKHLIIIITTDFQELNVMIN